MRRARLKVPADRPVGYYHCLSRVVDRRFVPHETEKDQFVSLMREYEAFCEVEVLTYCVMSNHFHILVEVPKRPEVLPGPEEIVAKLKRLSGEHFVGAVEQRFAMHRAAGDTAGEAAYLETFYQRMWDVSLFMKAVKQRFTQWYNGRMDRKGSGVATTPSPLSRWSRLLHRAVVVVAEALVFHAAQAPPNPSVQFPKDMPPGEPAGGKVASGASDDLVEFHDDLSVQIARADRPLAHFVLKFPL